MINNYTIILISIPLIIMLFVLDLNYCLKLERGAHNVLTIDNTVLIDQPYKEMYRYVDDTEYYNNIWRISLLCALVINMLLY